MGILYACIQRIILVYHSLGVCVCAYEMDIVYAAAANVWTWTLIAAHYRAKE